MISRICGKVKRIGEDYLLVEVSGICYEVLVPPTVLRALHEIQMQDGTVELVTYHYLHSDPSRSIPVLIGFLNELEREFFERFITVSGIGPKAAVKALAVPISRIARAIDEADYTFLKSLPGIGPQRAKQIIAKLQGKVSRFGLIQDKPPSDEHRIVADFKTEAIEILLQLQYRKYEAEEMVKAALLHNPGVTSAEELLNQVYKQKQSPVL
jgi:Holliday junction DNA helicase RuvA